MRMPTILRLLPPPLRQSVAFRFYADRHDNWRPLYTSAQLEYCRRVSMYDLVPGDVVSRSIAFSGFYELSLSREIVRLAHEGGLLVDVGANMGYFSLLWAGTHTNNTAIAFEAAPRNIKLIENNVGRNGFSGRITLVPKAVGDRKGEVLFDVGPADQTGWGGITVDGAGSIVVDAVRLDDVLVDEEIAVLKIDVEGADTFVLKGCERLLRSKRIRTIFFEQNAQRMTELGVGHGEALSYLKELGYVCTPLARSADEWTASPEAR